MLHRAGDDWETLAKLTVSDGAPDQYFGRCVSISGNVAAVGAYHDDDNGEWSGSAYVFVRPESGWTDMTQTGKLLPSDGASYDEFGLSFSISGDHILVGSSGDDPSGAISGSACVFCKPDSGRCDMRETAHLVASDGAVQDYFGREVFLSGASEIFRMWCIENQSQSGRKPAIHPAVCSDHLGNVHISGSQQFKIVQLYHP